MKATIYGIVLEGTPEEMSDLLNCIGRIELRKSAIKPTVKGGGGGTGFLY